MEVHIAESSKMREGTSACLASSTRSCAHSGERVTRVKRLVNAVKSWVALAPAWAAPLPNAGAAAWQPESSAPVVTSARNVVRSGDNLETRACGGVEAGGA